uniref:SGS domain-containing protein n=1 Tax=Brassica campestris TaxID=3711 RepID=M4F8N7_BRACM
MRPAYPSSKKVKDYDKLEAEVESIGTMLSIDWKDVGAKKIKKTLHDDLALKTWKI